MKNRQGSNLNWGRVALVVFMVVVFAGLILFTTYSRPNPEQQCRKDGKYWCESKKKCVDNKCKDGYTFDVNQCACLDSLCKNNSVRQGDLGCKCKPGTCGDLCQFSDSTCSGYGKICAQQPAKPTVQDTQKTLNNGKCVCDKGFSGLNCNISDTKCNSNGAVDGQGECRCGMIAYNTNKLPGNFDASKITTFTVIPIDSSTDPPTPIQIQVNFPASFAWPTDIVDLNCNEVDGGCSSVKARVRSTYNVYGYGISTCNKPWILDDQSKTRKKDQTGGSITLKASGDCSIDYNKLKDTNIISLQSTYWTTAKCQTDRGVDADCQTGQYGWSGEGCQKFTNYPAIMAHDGAGSSGWVNNASGVQICPTNGVTLEKGKEKDGSFDADAGYGSCLRYSQGWMSTSGIDSSVNVTYPNGKSDTLNFSANPATIFHQPNTKISGAAAQNSTVYNYHPHDIVASSIMINPKSLSPSPTMINAAKANPRSYDSKNISPWPGSAPTSKDQDGKGLDCVQLRKTPNGDLCDGSPKCIQQAQTRCDTTPDCNGFFYYTKTAGGSSQGRWCPKSSYTPDTKNNKKVSNGTFYHTNTPNCLDNWYKNNESCG